MIFKTSAALQTAAATTLTLSLLACSSESTETTTTDRPITYYEDIAPLFRAQCLSCHSEGGIAPFVLDSYEDAKLNAFAARAETAARTMPPWGMNNSGECHTFTDARWLSDEQIAIVGKWIDEGMLEGDPAKLAPAAARSSSLEGATFRASMPEPYDPVPISGHDDWRCFALETESALASDVFVTGFEVEPGDPRIVHHLLVYALELDRDGLRALDEQDEGPGWSCSAGGGAGARSELIAVWTPGDRIVKYPAGTGLRLAKDRQLMIEVHYSLESGPGRDQTALRFAVADSVEQPAKVILSDGILFSGVMIPPGMRSVEQTWTQRYCEIGAGFSDRGGGPPEGVEPGDPGDPEGRPPRDGMSFDECAVPGLVLPESVLVYGVFPHMHQTGRSLRATLRDPAAGDSCAADVYQYDFHWQQFYFYDRPLEIRDGMAFDVTCEFDTSDRTEPTLAGQATENEMCSFILYAVAR